MVKTYPKSRILLKIIPILVSILIAASCGGDNQPKISKAGNGNDLVVVHAGAANGAYATLVKLLNTRDDCDANDTTIDDSVDLVDRLRWTLANWLSSTEPAACMSEFEFKVACKNGGTEQNLIRLGMKGYRGSQEIGRAHV